MRILHRQLALPAAAAALAAALAAHAQSPLIPSGMATAAADAESLPTSRAMIAALAALAKPGWDEKALKSMPASSTRATFKVAGQEYVLTAAADATTPRRASSATGPGIAFLIKLPDTTGGMTSGDPERDAQYALATATGTRISIWAFYSRTPSDSALSQRMTAALARVGPPLAMIDPSFQATPGTGAAGYILK